MHWDTQTYLTGLFHQDDRMSMAASLESRVPFADPRMVDFAFHIDPDLKLRSGASKWILREAVSDVLPALVLNRRKVGFDTPAESWIKGAHSGFVRDLLLSTGARQRGFWNPAAIESLLEHQADRGWFDVVWKLLSIEMWASVFLDGVTVPPAVRAPAEASTHVYSLVQKTRHFAQECHELGVRGTLARGLWEMKTRSGFVQVKTATEAEDSVRTALDSPTVRLPFSDPAAVADAMRGIMPAAQLAALAGEASEGARGRILCFSKWVADYGSPIDWHRDPVAGHRWSRSAHWSRVLHGAPRNVDVKFTWEAARFPQAYAMARAAAFDPASARQLSQAFAAQVTGFAESNPSGRGVHWFSGQEVALRMFAWLFGYHVFNSKGLVTPTLRHTLASNLFASGWHIAEHIEYARDSVYNNHLLSEALGLCVAGRLLNEPIGEQWVREGLVNLDLQAARQIYPDGAYIQQSHNYHRVAMQIYLWASAFMRANGEQPPAAWTEAMERSLDFLLAHQSPADGSVPNFGANDGSHPLLLSSGELNDFRPVLQALSIATRGERIYDPGPWDEMALWLCGPHVLDLPRKQPRRASVSFAHTGYHVLRGNDESSLCTFRCGSVLDRFSQIDMLHLDVCWRGQRVLADGGSYRYNGAAPWHNHFLRTESHNTVGIDGQDQMLHFRQFKMLYWTEARLLRFENTAEWALCEGEHYGYRREQGCTHRRAVLFAKDDIWVVADTITGEGAHQIRLHWLGGDYPAAFDQATATLQLTTPAGDFAVSILDEAAVPVTGADVVSGANDPPRGWQSLHYGHKVAVPSLAATSSGPLPVTFVTVMGPADVHASQTEGNWLVQSGQTGITFRIENGCFARIEATR